MKKAFLLILSLSLFACADPVESTSGVGKATATVTVGSDGLTTEQRNIKARTEQDNLPGAIQHLYVISAYSGQVILYSTVRGKVTSSGKRLTPAHLASGSGMRFTKNDFLATDEMIGDDGAYGSSEPYLYWYDSKGVYHQHYVSGGQIIHISDQPVNVGSVIINMEAVAPVVAPAVSVGQ